MKTLKKVFIVLLVIGCVFGIMSQNISMAASADVSTIVGGVEAQNPDSSLATDFQTTIGKLLGFLQIASGLIAILMIAITGFNYIVSTPDVKEEMKKKMFPIIVGFVLVFGAVSIARFILGAVGA